MAHRHPCAMRAAGARRRSHHAPDRTLPHAFIARQRTPDHPAPAHRRDAPRARPRVVGVRPRPRVVGVRQCPAMMPRRGRPNQVRPRPPSSGRPRPAAPVPRRPAVPRIPPPRTPEAPRSLPMAVKAALGVSVVALVAVILLAVAGALPRIVSTVGGAVSGIAGAVLPSPSPIPTVVVVPAAPVLDAPAQTATNHALVTVTGSVPADIIGQGPGFTIRLYVTLPKKAAVRIAEIPVGATPNFSIPDVALQPGRNDFSATVTGPGGESKASPLVTYVLDTSKPKICLLYTSPSP